MGGSLEHELIITNVQNALKNQLADRQCFVLGQGMQIKVPAAPPYRYADGSVVCGQIIREQFNGTDHLVNPILLFEVLSPSTAAYDQGDKFTFYKSIPTFQEYLLIAQDRVQLVQHRKQRAGNWERQQYSELADIITLTSIDCSLALRDVYSGVEFG